MTPDFGLFVNSISKSRYIQTTNYYRTKIFEFFSTILSLRNFKFLAVAPVAERYIQLFRGFSKSIPQERLDRILRF